MTGDGLTPEQKYRRWHTARKVALYREKQKLFLRRSAAAVALKQFADDEHQQLATWLKENGGIFKEGS